MESEIEMLKLALENTVKQRDAYQKVLEKIKGCCIVCTVCAACYAKEVLENFGK